MIRLVDAATVRPLRQAVLRPGQDLGAVTFPEDELAAAFHVAEVDGSGRVLACATAFPEPFHGDTRAWRLRGMASDVTVRGRGYGAAVLDRATDEVRTAGGSLVWCNARLAAAGFYARAGFVSDGAEFTVAGIGPHVVMWTPVGARGERGARATGHS